LLFDDPSSARRVTEIGEAILAAQSLRLTDAEGQPIKLFIRPGETVIHPNVYYLETVRVYLIGYWHNSFSNF
jgi:hypothetical protein